ncbi:hypothetical protein GpartN1_g2856.t1 [Galdieria partita]|uniref:Uncharacterized protein n=1 Tax=Galdieria partita TaxID=83374 RepID=A0A9C7UQ13_9RHOD|nr:hypothetical protein GpartN1_g2856.t1 [Galdieria partita]
MSKYWKETCCFSWSYVTDWQEFSVVIEESTESCISDVGVTEIWKYGGVVGSIEKGSLFLWRFQDNFLEVVSLSALNFGRFQGVRIVFRSQVFCCPPAIFVVYKTEREVELYIYAAHPSGIISRIALLWRDGLFYEPHIVESCFLSKDIFVKQLIAIDTNVCLVIVANWPTVFRVVFSDSSTSFRLLEIPETKEPVTKTGLLGRVFRKKRISEDKDAEVLVCATINWESRLLLVVDSSGVFSLIDSTLLSCVAQLKYHKLAKKEYCEIFPCEKEHFLAVLFVDDALSLSPSLHLVDIFIQQDSSDDRTILYSLQSHTRFIYNTPIHIQVGCYMKREGTLVVQDEEGRIFSIPISSGHLSSNESDPLYAVFDYYSEWNDYGGLGWALDEVYEKTPIQMLFAPSRFSDNVLAKIFSQPQYTSRKSLFSYANSQPFSTKDYKRLVLSATRLSWEIESSLLNICMDESLCVCFVVRQASVSVLRKMESFEEVSIQRDFENLSKTPSRENYFYDISSLPDIVRHSGSFELFTNSLLWNSLHFLLLQLVTCLKAWKQRHDIHETFQEDFLIYYANYPSEHNISSSLIDEFMWLCLKKLPYSLPLFEHSLNLWMKDNFHLERNNDELDCWLLLCYYLKFFTPSPNIIVFLYDRNEWHTLLQVCEMLKESYPIICYGIGCWIHLRLHQVDLAELSLTQLLAILEETEFSSETQLVKVVVGIEREPLSFWLREAFFKFLDRLGYTERAIRMGKEMIAMAKDDYSIASIRTFIFNGYLKNREWKNALELLLSSSHVGALSSWTDDFNLLIHSLAEHRQLDLLYTIQLLPPTLYYRIGEILYLLFQGQQVTRDSLSGGFIEHLLDSYRWYYFVKEFYLASRIALEGYCKIMESFNSIPRLPWLRTCIRLIGLVCNSLTMISHHYDRYLLLSGGLLETLCKESGFSDWFSLKGNHQVARNLKVRLEFFQFLGIVRGAQQWLLEHFPLEERSSCPLVKSVDISSVKWLLTSLIQHKEWNLSFQIAYQGSCLLVSDQLFVLWFRLVGIYLMEHESSMEADNLWVQIVNFLLKAESMYAKFSANTFSYGQFGIVLLQGILSHAPIDWCIPRWLLELSGWGEYSGFHEDTNVPNHKRKGNMSRLMQLLIEHGRLKEALEFMCVTLENKQNSSNILLTWTFVDALLCMKNEDDILDKDIIKAQRRLKDLALTCLKQPGLL